MLCANNIKDKEKMMKYTRSRDMLNLLLYFPKLSPVMDLTIIESLDDYYKNYEQVKEMFYKRCDNLVRRNIINLETIGGEDENIPLLTQIKQIDKNGVLLLFNLTAENKKRYEYDGGMAVAVNVGNGVIIESVGKGFDGREVSKGITTHERYCIPWSDLRNLCISNLEKYREYIVEQKKYVADRQDRINYLIEKGFDKNLACKYIPEKYQQIKDITWRLLFSDMIKKLEKMEEELISSGMDNFAVSGNIVDNVFGPWQMFDKNRFTLSLNTSYNNKIK